MRTGIHAGNLDRVPLIAACLYILLGISVVVLSGGSPIITFFVLLLPCAITFAFYAVNSAQVRLYAFVGFGMLVMQSESGWASNLKPVYFLMVVTFGCMGLANIKYLNSDIRKALKPIFLGSGLLLAIVVAYAIYSIAQGEAISRVIRDAFTYILIAAAPIIGADASRQSTLVSARLFVAAVGGLAAISFSIFWLSARQVGVLGVDRLFMFSIILSGLGIMMGMVYGLFKLNPIWLAFGSFCLLAILVTGTRSGLLLVMGLLGAVGSMRRKRIPLPRLAAGMLVIAASAYFLVPTVSGQVARDGFMESRMRALANVFEGGVEADASGRMRYRAYEILLDIWIDRPLLGVGFGRAFESVRPGGAPVDFQLDSGMLILAKFGLVGGASLIVAVGLILFGLGVFHKKTNVRSEVQAIATAFTLMVFGFFLLGVPMEDKGFAYSISLLVYLLAVHNRTVISRSRLVSVHESGQMMDTLTK